MNNTIVISILISLAVNELLGKRGSITLKIGWKTFSLLQVDS